MKRKIIMTFLVLCMLAACVWVCYPYIIKAYTDYEHNQAIEAFEERAAGSYVNTTPDKSKGEKKAADQTQIFSNDYEVTDYVDLFNAMKEYNDRIYTEGQKDLVDAWSYQQTSFVLTDWGVEDNVIAYISIPSIDSELPIYLGATNKNMAKGAVHLSETSLPIGGMNTNCVLAAHRGYSGIPMWRNIEGISVGDYVYVRNLWTTMVYQVTSTAIINPNDSDLIRIQEGRDMLTLITCHPYRGHGKYRYLVYCDRVNGDLAALETDAEELPVANEEAFEARTPDNMEIADGIEFVSSQADIEQEQMVQRAGVAMVAFALVLVIFILKPKKKSKQKSKTKTEGSENT